MQTELEKLDAIKSRMKVSYEEARKALEESGGDVVQTLVNIEQKRQSDLVSVGIELLDDIQKMVQGPACKKLRVKFGERTVAEYPIALTAAAALFVGLAAILISKSSIEIEHEEEEPEG